jgi:lipopolysaccharide transport protein LptA/LPS export ABC transporter protein LptC
MKLRPIQWALLGAGGALAVLLALTFRRVPRPRTQALPTPAPPGAPSDAGKPTTLLTVFDYTESASGRPRFRIHADRTVGFAQGAGLPSTWYGLEKVALTLYSQKDPPVTVIADRADYDPRTNAANLSGNVLLSEPGGTTVRTSRMSFDPAGNTVKIPEPIAFSRAGMSGRAVSGLYDLSTRSMSFAGPVTVRGTPGPGSPFSALDAKSAVYRQAVPELELDGEVRGEGGGNTLSSDSLTLHLTDENRVDQARAAGAVTGMIAAGRTPTTRETYSGREARLWFDGAGKASRAELLGAPAVVVEPASARSGPRRVAAPRLSLALAGGKLASSRAEGGVRIETTGRGPSSLQTVESDAADASYGPDGRLSSATFTGGVRGSSPDGNGSAPRAVYSASRNVTVLTALGPEEARLSSPRGRLLASSIEIDGDNSVVTATGHARAFFSGEEGRESAPRFLSGGGKPTRGRARRIVLDDRRRTALLTGEAALWQEDSALFGDEIFLNDADRSATAKGSVRATALSAGEKGGPPARFTATSDRMRYEDSRRTASFEDRVRVLRGEARASGDRAEARFDEEERVESISLDGRVTFEDPATGRSGEGDHALDEPRRGITVLTGDPAVARDGKGDKITGAVLTFRKQSGSVEAKAKDGQRIETIYQTHGA